MTTSIYRTVPYSGPLTAYAESTKGDSLTIVFNPSAPIPFAALLPDVAVVLVLVPMLGLSPARIALIGVLTFASAWMRARSPTRHMQTRLLLDRRGLRIARPFDYWARTWVELGQLRRFEADDGHLLALRHDGAVLPLPTTGLLAAEVAALAETLERHRESLAG